MRRCAEAPGGEADRGVASLIGILILTSVGTVLAQRRGGFGGGGRSVDPDRAQRAVRRPVHVRAGALRPRLRLRLAAAAVVARLPGRRAALHEDRERAQPARSAHRRNQHPRRSTTRRCSGTRSPICASRAAGRSRIRRRRLARPICRRAASSSSTISATAALGQLRVADHAGAARGARSSTWI